LSIFINWLGGSYEKNSITFTHDYTCPYCGTSTHYINKTFGGEEDDVAKAVIKTDDGYLIAGKTKSFTSNRDYNAYLIKLDKSGEKIWSKIYGGKYDDEANAVTAYEKGFVFVGSTKSYGNDNISYYFAKLDANGEPQWQKNYFRGERDYYFGNDIVADGKDLVIAGS